MRRSRKQAWHRYKGRGRFAPPIIAKSAVNAYLARKRNRYDWIKRIRMPDLREATFGSGFVTKPKKRQLACFLIGMEEETFLFNLDPGLGKSKLALDLIRYHMMHSGVERTLVLVPNLINIESWRDQIREHAPDLKGVYLDTLRQERHELVNEDADVFILNYAGLMSYMCETRRGKRTINDYAAKSFAKMFDAVVFDEIHNLGHQDTLWYRMCLRLIKCCDIRYGLSGTIMGRNPEMLWSQFYLIDKGYTLGETLGIYRAAFFNAVPGEWKAVEFHFNHHKRKLLHEFIQNKSIRFTKEECADLPPVSYIKEPLSWGDEQLIYYKRAIGGIQKAAKHKITLNRNNFMTLRQITSGFVGYTEGEEKKRMFFSENPKLIRLLQLVDEVYPDKIVVFHFFIPSGRMIAEALKKAKVGYAEIRGETQDPAKEFRKFLTDPECRVLVANWKSGGAGINPQKVANYVYFFESPPDPISRKQAEERVLREGQTKDHVFIYDPVMPKSIDERILDYLGKGKDLFEAICNGREVDYESISGG